MHTDFTAAAIRFEAFRNALESKSPESIAEADTVADDLLDYRVASAEQVWSVMWNKPLYANRRLDVAKRLVEMAKPSMPGVWKTDNRVGPFSVSRKPKHLWVDKQGKKNGSFYDDTGLKIDQFQRNGIAYQFSFAMIEAGRYLKARANRYDPPIAEFGSIPLDVLVDELAEEIGFNWGHITVLHFLTDLGLACKPDIHLVRCMDALGIYTCESKTPNFDEAIKINGLVKEFLHVTYGEPSARNLRHLDKVLMEISRQQVLPAFVYEKWPEPEDNDGF